MLSGVTTICFTASYAVAWALELSRLIFRSRVRGLAMICFVGAGLVAQTIFLYYRAARATGAPLSSERDWYLMAAWALVAIYLYLVVSRPKTPFGLFLLPLALALIGIGTFWANTQSINRDSASRVWGTIHGSAIVLAAVAVLVGFVAGLMYLGKAWRLKRKHLPTGGLSLPSLEWLQLANSRAIVVAVAMLAVGIMAGTVLNRINITDPAARLGWTDPVVVSTWLMFFWLLAAVVLVARHRPARQGRKVAYLTLAAFVFLAIVLSMGLLVETKHWGRGKRGAGRVESGVASGQWLVARKEGRGERGEGRDQRSVTSEKLRPTSSIFHNTTEQIFVPQRLFPLPSPLSPLPSPPTGGPPC